MTPRAAVCFLLASLPALGARTWTVRVEEPTGIYPRTQEVVTVPLARLGGSRSGFTVIDGAGRELPWQTTDTALLFPVSMIPGELPEYLISCCVNGDPARFANEIVARKLGLRRIEVGNSRFRAMIDTGVPAIVEAYSLTAGPQRMLNLVETSPESAEAVKEDLHAARFVPFPPVPGVAGENSGWTSLGGTGAMTAAEIVEEGPLRGRVRMTRAGESWELTWTASSGALIWKAHTGFRFAAVSATPYLPFNRFVAIAELKWPDGSSTTEPEEHQVAPRNWRKPPDGHGVYYNAAENYGALGIVALDPDLEWTGLGARRFTGSKSGGDTGIAITFPRWKGWETLLEARKENRILRQPLLVQVSAQHEEPAPRVAIPAGRMPPFELRATPIKTTPFVPDALVLDGDWDLAWCEKGAGPPDAGWRTVTAPGSAHIQWLGRDKIYTREAEWVSHKEWWYRKRFRAPAHFAGRRLRLQFEATDYYADTYLDSRWLGRHEGYIDPYGYDVSRWIRPGAEHELLVRVWTPVSYYWRHRPYTIKGSYGAVDQKPDNITALGITHSARLVASDETVVAGIAVDTRLTEDGATVEVRLDADGPADGLQWLLTLSPRTFRSNDVQTIRAPVITPSSTLVIPVKNPRLWWTWDHGRPDLYTLEVRLLDASGRAIDGRTVSVGIREIEKIGWDFYLNRKRLFIRGTNYYYNLFLSDMNRSAYERDLSLMLQMNVNMIRLHCHFSNREFYDLADERGVLLWQDFLEAWYPEDRAFSLRAAALYDAHIRYVRNHPSVAIWATSDEESLENYRDLTKHLAPRLFVHDPQRRPVIRSTGRYGDGHVYHGWYGGSIWQYAQMEQAFVSELGATSLPNYETLIRFLPQHWPIRDHEEEWTWRKLQIPEAMQAWGDPGSLSLKEYIPRTQAYAARLFQLALERQRRRKGDGAGGILHFHAIDIWPSVTMAAIDFERRPTKVFDTVRRSFEPVAASLEYDRDQWRKGETVRCGVWAINDRWEAVKGSIRWRIVDHTGKQLHTGSWAASMPPDSASKLGDAVWRASEAGSYELRAEVIGAGGQVISENLFEFMVEP